MLKSELNKLENYISEIINKDMSLVDLTWHQQMTEQVKSVLEICKELKSKWTHELFSSVKEQVITRYVQYHQAGITQLSDQISRTIPVNNPLTINVTGPEHFFGQILSELEELLSFLRHQCYHYFDLDYKITIYSCRRQCAQIEEFRRKLASYSGNEIELSLVEVIGISVREMTDDALQSGISAVNPNIKNYGRVAETISIQVSLVGEYKRNYRQFRQSGSFNAAELDYISNVYGKLVKESLENIDELFNVTTASKLRMSDAERIKAIDRIYAASSDKLQFLRSFNNQGKMLSLQRSKAIAETRTLKQLYGITN